MQSSVIVKNFQLNNFDKSEILRYAGVKDADESVLSLVDECLSECENLFSARVCYAFTDIVEEGEFLKFGPIKTDSSSLKRNMQNCSKAVVFACSVGEKIDAVIRKYSYIAPSKAVIFQAIGAERIEELTESFFKFIKAEEEGKGNSVRARFSPGYSDLPLSVQEDIFKLLSPEKNIGVYLNGAYLMTPSKSVTALIGIEEK